MPPPKGPNPGARTICAAKSPVSPRLTADPSFGNPFQLQFRRSRAVCQRFSGSFARATTNGVIERWRRHRLQVPIGSGSLSSIAEATLSWFFPGRRAVR